MSKVLRNPCGGKLHTCLCDATIMVQYYPQSTRNFDCMQYSTCSGLILPVKFSF